MDLYLVRHGETEGNLGLRLQGWTDSGLSALGRRQAALTGRRLAERFAEQGRPAVALYSSDLGRAWETATIIGAALGLIPIADPGQREQHFGIMEDTVAADWEPYPDLLPRWRDWTDLDFGWPAGETRRAFRARVAAAVTAIVTRHRPGDQVIIVTHGGPIRAYLAQGPVRGPEPAGQEPPRFFHNCSVTHVAFAADGDAPGGGRVLAWDRQDHLEGL